MLSIALKKSNVDGCVCPLKIFHPFLCYNEVKLGQDIINAEEI